MKRIILSIITLCLVLFQFAWCRTDYVYVAEYKYINNSSSTITITQWRNNQPEEHDKIVIPPGEEYKLRYAGEGGFFYPFFENGKTRYQLSADNGERFVISKRNGTTSMTGLFNTENYELVYERKRERHYRFIFTDDYFKDGEPIENMPE